VQFICVALLSAATLQVLANCTDLPSPRDLREPVFPQTVGFADCFVDSQTTLFEADVQRTQSCGTLCVLFMCSHKVCNMFSLLRPFCFQGLHLIHRHRAQQLSSPHINSPL
jgi:hypothetical protein